MLIVDFVSIFGEFHVILFVVLVRIFIVIFCGGLKIGRICFIRRIGGRGVIFGRGIRFVFLFGGIFFIFIGIGILARSIEGRVSILLLLFSFIRSICKAL